MKLFIFIGLITVGLAAGQTPGVCPPTGIHAIAYPGSCQRFIRCFNGVAIPQECAPGLAFDAVLGQCNTPAEANCNPCQGNADTDITFIRDEQNCARFTMCIGRVLSENTCSAGFYFDLVSRTCAQSHLVDCPSSGGPGPGPEVPGPEPEVPGPGPEDPEGVDGTCNLQSNFEMIASVSSCERYTICACGHPHVRYCPAGLVYDVVSQGCNTRENGGQCLRESAPFCAPTTVEQLAHPFDCRHYVLCINGTPTVMACAPGLEVNRRTNKCDFPHVAQCSSRTPLTYIELMNTYIFNV